MTQVTVQRDGLTLVGDYIKPNQETYDLAILFHGFKANRNSPIIKAVSDSLNQAGLATMRFDFDGCGDSDGKFENMTVPGEIADANAIFQFALADHHVKNIYLVGHSQGGVVASMLAGLYPNAELIKKVVLLAPAATLRSDALKGDLQGIPYNPNDIPEAIQIGNFTVGGFYLRTAQILPIYDVAKHYQGPVCLIHGTNDQVVSPNASKKYHEVYKNSILHLVNGADHRFTPPYQKIAVDYTTNFLH
ncbi:alpha/beta hydrolase [Lactobacillus sp. PV012]|uniref:alpha/beta hydrolase n=1 Tax=Lactobacillus sp. PV012 TaxID=2594494 RepID=UPI0022406196|nr:alpha/beta fold hydrolase [Lactobacillus sp. PV012]QNQ82820.1 lysophospholipase [Lactobacillus sp. PV012]